ncbi:MAG: hypothetical protein EKK61_05065 [Rickettsiales bacterium]|nr:MAG: hypothetical protein EKK61_05065 [Rickettsiales bacterium]
MKSKTLIIYLTGKPGVGKYTIAKELAGNGEFIICDNQLINNPIFELLGYDGFSKIPEMAWDSIRHIRTEIFNFLTKFTQKSYILTNNLYEDEGDRNLYEQVKKMTELRGSIFVPVKLVINEQEHLRRVTQTDRKNRLKTIDPQCAYDKTPLLSYTHHNLLELDISNLKPEEVACSIMEHVEKINFEK